MSAALPYFVVVYRPAARYPQGTTEEIAHALSQLPEMQAHMRHLGEALARGQIEQGGPINRLDAAHTPAGGVVIYRGLDRAALQAFIDADPMVSGGYEEAEVYHYTPALRGAAVD